MGLLKTESKVMQQERLAEKVAVSSGSPFLGAGIAARAGLQACCI